MCLRNPIASVEREKVLNLSSPECPLVPTLCVGTQVCDALRRGRHPASAWHGTQSVRTCVPTRSVGTRTNSRFRVCSCSSLRHSVKVTTDGITTVEAVGPLQRKQPSCPQPSSLVLTVRNVSKRRNLSRQVIASFVRVAVIHFPCRPLSPARTALNRFQSRS
jgi:hypothetical protein